MDLGHFQYLLDGGSEHTKVASDRLELLAKTAAKRYLEEKANLTSTIKKLAEENDLNPEQIRRVCEMANIATHNGLWSKTAEKDKIAFDVADAENIIKVVPKSDNEAGAPPPCPSGSTTSDYAGPPTGLPSAGPSILSSMGDPEKVHHGLHEVPEKKKIIIILQKKAEERKSLKSDLLYKGMQLETLEKKAFEATKQAVLGGETFEDLLLAAAGCGLGKTAAEYFLQWQEDLIEGSHGEMHNRLVKEAIHKAPDDLVSDDLRGVTVVNGAHPVMISLDTVQRKTGEIKNGIHNLLRIDDEIKVFQQKIRDLS